MGYLEITLLDLQKSIDFKTYVKNLNYKSIIY